ncbi:hypothetical protein [Mycobacterium simiae]|uniref:hypothetical protein n=1 Tax=Mycobacterium simiae TaxID=1784 RepID=UPI001CB6C15B|nr:hypothetical protein [Mycobacterium simiae]
MSELFVIDVREYRKAPERGSFVSRTPLGIAPLLAHGVRLLILGLATGLVRRSAPPGRHTTFLDLLATPHVMRRFAPAACRARLIASAFNKEVCFVAAVLIRRLRVVNNGQAVVEDVVARDRGIVHANRRRAGVDVAEKR